MAKRKTKKPKSGHPARNQSSVVSLNQVKIQRGLDALTLEFTRWYGEGHGALEPAILVLRVVSETLTNYTSLVDLESISDIQVDILVALLESLVAPEDVDVTAQDMEELRTFMSAAWVDFTDFLEETGRWTQDPEELVRLREQLLEDDPSDGLFDARNDDGFEGFPAIFRRELQLELLEMPFLRLARSVLGWCTAKERGNWPQPLDSAFLEQACVAVAADLPEILSAEQASRLINALLVALEEGGIVQLLPGQPAQSTTRAKEFQASEGAGSADAQFDVLDAFLEKYLAPASTPGTELDGAWTLVNLWVVGALSGASEEVNTPRYEEFDADTWETAHHYMQILRGLGLVHEGERYSLPKVVSALLTADLDTNDDDDDLDLDWLGGLNDEENQRPQRTEPYRGPVLQLKLGLRDSKPPIWRRLLIPTDLTLADLHQIIQISFDWADAHLHEFRTGGRRGATYGPANPYSEVDHFEGDVLISEVLSKEKDKLDYSYDFGDDWRVRIDVEKVVEADGGHLPRCTGGRRMAPMEDSGGMYGWESKLEILADPAHPEHDEVREWLEDMGLDPEYGPDPSEFSGDFINEAFEGIF
ncbi:MULTISPECIES: plasmid pRiA4b ORF-3 family protein [Glutamicibacter]|uniref:plasmid pRiA4b ORF-3 family protein n=1 Tax=Glutamicibacter TaxID=1742989 RepID=UPI000ECE32BA|nr:plasmid pRiA4b ORF-3 family protein [Glutamicibacter sp.]HCJ55806.1 hypothetical protein [Glutamicibacter sp.]